MKMEKVWCELEIQIHRLEPVIKTDVETKR